MNGNKLYYGFCGVLLVVVGAVLLMVTNGVLPPFESDVWQTWLPRLFAAIGLIFLVAFVTNVRDRWAAVIPGLILVALAGVAYFGDQLDNLAGPLFLAAIGLSFLLIFIVRREFWWAIIPAGSLFSIAATAWLVAGSDSNEKAGVAVMFLGFALTFLAIFLVRDERGFRKWALIPAAICLGMSGLIALATGAWLEAVGWLGYLGPAALIVGGAAILVGALRKKEARGADEKTPAPKT